MAEIPVQPKRGPRAWVWIVALIVLAIILWLVFGSRQQRPAITTGAVPATQLAPGVAVRAVA
ncbi:MAG: hypothetical protein IRY91_10280 [Gemmatimonadaceae bacterium]|nr:hypothetical protein [Gemmatimonadaceae bacterium]